MDTVRLISGFLAFAVLAAIVYRRGGRYTQPRIGRGLISPKISPR